MEKENSREHHAIKLANEIWFKGASDSEVKHLIDVIENCDVNATIRLGDRTERTSDPKLGYQAGTFIELKVQNPDNTFQDATKKVLVKNIQKKIVSDLQADDLAGAALDGATSPEVIAKLEKVYGRKLTEADMVTIMNFEFTEKIKGAGELLESGAMKIAKLPADNPSSLDFDHYTLPLIEHDYPAKTPVMWNAAYRKFGLKTGNIMLVGDPTHAKEILTVLENDPKYLGGGAGVGFKDEASKHLELDPAAEAIGAINFILKTPEGKLRGYNTDGLGYAESLAERFAAQGEDIRGKKAVLLGAGGTGNAVAFALAEKGMKITILNRTEKKAEELATRINRYIGAEIASFGGELMTASEITSADAVINVSTKGAAGEMAEYSALAPARLPATPENLAENYLNAARLFEFIPKKAVVSDIVLTKEGTPFLKKAAELGFETLDGVPMVVNQGVEAFWLLHSKELIEKGVTKQELAETMKEAANRK
ncbi:MAG: hypothetical protein WC725_03580 [Patescibacteria group bacterium]|jgi:shikimate dehydrogenase